jgi:hypothetical protein
MVVRTYQEECSYIERLTSSSFRIKKGFVDNMKVLLAQHHKTNNWL